MAGALNPIPGGIADYLRKQEGKGLLRFLTCGSVGGGKSTLVGRLLFESKMVFEEPLAALAAGAKGAGTRGGGIDFALLLDGPGPEREQGTTIDAAYRCFATSRRAFIVADTPSHLQHTRSMVVGASNADLAVVLVDARKGVSPQARRDGYLVGLLGIRHVVLAVNRMDLVDYSREVFAGIEADFREFGSRIRLANITCIPICAANGDNVVVPGGNTPWYEGASLMEHLESVPVDDDLGTQPFRMPVQRVDRSDAGFGGLAGTIVGGSVRLGDRIRILPSGRESTVACIVTADGDLALASANQSVTLTLADEIDVSRGDVVSAAAEPIETADQFEATLVWMGDSPLAPGRDYLMKIAATTATATVAPLKYRIDVDSLENLAATKLTLGQIGVCQLELDRPIAFEPFERNRDLGGFVLIDRLTKGTVAAGMLRFALRRAHNIHWQSVEIDRAARASLKGQRPCVLWLTGLSASGKSTIANLVERKLHAMGRHTYLLDGDNVRHGLNKDLGFTEAARVENIRRIAEVAKLMADAGLIVIAAFISPFRSERRMARGLLPEGEFLEVFVDVPLEVAEARDPKGLYRKARRGELRNFTGIDSPYERPERAEIVIRSASTSAEDAAELIVEEMRSRGF